MTDNPTKKTPEEGQTGSESVGESPPPASALNNDKLWSILSYVPILCLIPILREDADSDLRLHARQGCYLMLLMLLLLLLLIPGVTELILWVGLSICVLFAVIGAISAAQGRYWRIPIISDVAEGRGLKGLKRSKS